MKYRVLLADIDGTLFDFHYGESIAMAELFRQYGYPATEENVRLYLEANENQWKKLERGETTSARLRVDRFVDFLAATGLEGDPQKLSDSYILLLGQQRWPIEGCVELCREVSRHMPVYLVTNGIAAIQRSRLSGSVIEPYVKGIVISEEVGKSKPDPAMLFEALSQAGVDPKEAVVLGDSITADIAAANNAGIDSILFTNGREAPQNHGATYTAQTLAEACRIILQ